MLISCYTATTNRLVVSRIPDKASGVRRRPKKKQNKKKVNIILRRADNKLISAFPLCTGSILIVKYTETDIIAAKWLTNMDCYNLNGSIKRSET